MLPKTGSELIQTSSRPNSRNPFLVGTSRFGEAFLPLVGGVLVIFIYTYSITFIRLHEAGLKHVAPYRVQCALGF
jgi:hypothetical protein